MVDVSVNVIHSGGTEPGLDFYVEGGEGFWISEEKARVLFEEMRFALLNNRLKAESKRVVDAQFINNIFDYLVAIPTCYPTWIETPLASFWRQLSYQYPEVFSWLVELVARLGHPELEVVRIEALKELNEKFPTG